MPEKLAPGVIHHQAPRQEQHEKRKKEALDKVRARRDASRWTLAMGVGMMFMGSFSASFAVGGALMVAGGFGSSLWHGRKLRRLEGDPWEHDPELDAWEEEHLKE